MQADDYACHASIHYIRYDDTFNFRPTQGHMLIPLTDYHAGASAAAFVGHAHAYDWALAQYFGAGLINTQVGGSTLYSDEATHSKIKWWTSFVKLYRETLIQPIIHLRRATGQRWDGFMHPHPRALGTAGLPGGSGAVVGVAVVFNPAAHRVTETIALPLYYTGLTDGVLVTLGNASSTGAADPAPVKMQLERDYFLLLKLEMAPSSYTTVLLVAP